MAGDSPSIHALNKDVKAAQILKQERQDLDCTPCRIIGGTAFIGLGVYTHYEGQQQLKLNQAQIQLKKSMLGMRQRQIGLMGISAGLVWMGIYRLFG